MVEPMAAESHTLLSYAKGLHARPAVRMAQLAARFRAKIFIRLDDQGEWVSASSAAQLMRLKARPNSVVCFRAEGEDARQAVVEMAALVDRDFSDMPEGEWALAGEIASPGLACGKLKLSAGGGNDAPPEPQEFPDLRGVLDAAREELGALAARVDDMAGRILAFQLALLDDEGFLEPLWQSVSAGESPLVAWRRLLEDEIGVYRDSGDEYLRARELDLRDLLERVEGHLLGRSMDTVAVDDGILVCDELPPSRFLALDPQSLRGLVLTGGSPVSHTAILARRLGMPMLIQVDLTFRQLPDDSDAVLDAEAGRLIVNPKVTTMTRYSKTLTVRAMESAVSEQFLSDPGQTGDGEPVRVCLEVAELSHLDGLNPEYCDGIAWVRSESLFDLSQEWPDEDTQYRRYRRLLDWAEEAPVAICTFNASPSTTPPPDYRSEMGGHSPLGLRGIRLSLACQASFGVQVQALCRVAAEGRLRVLLPMLSTPAELEQVRQIFDEAVTTLSVAGKPARMPELGLLISVPATALSLEPFDQLAMAVVDVDALSCFLLAVDQSEPGFEELKDPTHPALLGVLRGLVRQAGSRGLQLGVAGTCLTQPGGLTTILDTGVRTLVVATDQLARLKAGLAEL